LRRHRLRVSELRKCTFTLRDSQTLVLSVLLYASETWTSLASDMTAIESFHMKCQRRILGIRWHDLVRNSEVSLRTGLAPVSDRITRGRNAIFGHVARLPVNTPAHQAMLRQVELSVGRPQTLHGNVHQVDHVPNGPTNSAAITTMFPLRLCGGKPLVAAVTRERRYGPSRLRVNDDDDDDDDGRAIKAPVRHGLNAKNRARQDC